MAKATLRHPQTNCGNCPLYKDVGKKTTYVPTDIEHNGIKGEAPQVDVLFIGGSPGKDDDDYGLPFVGAGGQLLRETIGKFKGKTSLAMANTVRCRATDEEGKNRNPNDIEVGFCSGYARSDIAQLKPKVVVLCGGTAIAAYNPDHDDPAWVQGKVGTARTGLYKEKDGIKYVATMNPGAVARNPGQVTLLSGDIRKAFDIAKGREGAYGNKGTSTLITTIGEFNDLKNHIIHDLTEEDMVAVDTETLNVNRVGHNAVQTWQFAYDENTGYIVPDVHDESPWTPEQREQIILPGLSELFSSTESKFSFWLAHSSQFEIDKIQRFLPGGTGHLGVKGIYKTARPVVDTLFMMYALDENRCRLDGAFGDTGGPYKLKTLATEFLGFSHYDQETLEARAKGELWMQSLAKLSEYGGMDAYVTYRLFLKIIELAGKYAPKLIRLAKLWGWRVFTNTACIERNGVEVDMSQMELLQSDESPILQRLSEIPPEIFAMDETKAANAALVAKDPRTKGMKSLFGKKNKPVWLFDLDKKDHKIELLINQFGLEVVGRGKEKTKDWPQGLPSIDKAFYASHSKDNKAAELCQEMTGLKKLKSSYLTNILGYLTNHADMQDGRIRPSLLWTRTVTGRGACKSPNTQQIPRGDNPYKKEIKSMFCSAPGHILAEVDYAQAEVRWWAQISGDTEYAKLFDRMYSMRRELYANPHDKELATKVKLECDVHRQVASLMLQKTLAEVTPHERQAAKNLTFGAIYGQAVQTLAGILKISVAEAQDLQDRFLNRFRHAGQWLHDIEQFAIAHGYVESATGRRRNLAPDLNSGVPGLVNGAKRMARNSPIQASSSDMMAFSCCQIQDKIFAEQRPWVINNLVHDSILFELPLDYELIIDCARTVEDMMTDTSDFAKAFKIDMIVRHEVDFKFGTRLGHLEDWGTTKPLTEIIASYQQA